MQVELRKVEVVRSSLNSNFSSVRINWINSVLSGPRKFKFKSPPTSIGILWLLYFSSTSNNPFNLRLYAIRFKTKNSLILSNGVHIRRYVDWQKYDSFTIYCRLDQANVADIIVRYRNSLHVHLFSIELEQIVLDQLQIWRTYILVFAYSDTPLNESYFVWNAKPCENLVFQQFLFHVSEMKSNLQRGSRKSVVISSEWTFNDCVLNVQSES